MTSVIIISVTQDIKRQKIPNYVTFPTMVMALVYYSFVTGLNSFLFSLGGLGLGLALFIVPYAMGGMGAGDVKLMMAVGSIVGPWGIVITSIMVILCGGVYGLILFALNPGYAASFLRRSWMTLKTLALTFQLVFVPPDASEKRPALRYAIPIALGAFGYMLMQITGYDLFPELLGDKFTMFSIARGGTW